MSIADFSAAMRDRAIKEWFNTEKGRTAAGKASNINTLVNPTSTYRSAESTASKNSFIITKDTVADLLVNLRGLSRADDSFQYSVDEVFKKFATNKAGADVQREVISVGPDLPAVYFDTISFDTITTLVNNILELDPNQLAAQYEKGHVIGLNTQLLQVTTNRIASLETSNARDLIVKELDNVIAYYKKLDLDTANLQPAGDIDIYASVNKSISATGVSKYLIELQPKAQNQVSALEVKDTISSIRKLFDPGIVAEKTRLDIIDKLTKTVSDPKFQQDLLNIKSSPSFKDMIAQAIADSLSGKSKDQEYSFGNAKVLTVKTPKANLSNINKVAKKKLAEVEQLKAKLTTKVFTARNLRGQFTSLSSIQAILTQRLSEQIKFNMGDGNRKDVLNYRTGRFANTASIERLTISREGLISVFYNYMKYPYQTFEPGFKQGAPDSRNPRLLISKSIRQIVATIASNRMRAILV